MNRNNVCILHAVGSFWYFDTLYLYSICVIMQQKYCSTIPWYTKLKSPKENLLQSYQRCSGIAWSAIKNNTTYNTIFLSVFKYFLSFQSLFSSFIIICNFAVLNSQEKSSIRKFLNFIFVLIKKKI